MTNKALILLGHPDPQSFNAALAAAYARGWRERGGEAEVIELGALRFDLVLRHGFRVDQPLEPDLVRVRDAIEAADHVAWFFPIWWGSPPALVRGLVDRVFLPKWAFEYKGHALPEGLLKGRSSRVVSTMDSPGWWYALAHRWALHATMGTGTLAFSGFAPVSFTLLHGVREMDAKVRERWLTRIAELGASEQRARRNPVDRPQLGAGAR